MFDSLRKRLAVASLNVSDVDVVRNTHDLMPRIPDVNWEAVDGAAYRNLQQWPRGGLCVCLHGEETWLV